MKKHITIALFIAVLTSVFNSGCGEDSNDTSTNNSACKTEGFVKCGGTCIDPTRSINYCGANENCENYTVCKDTETCMDSRCRTTKCEADEHHYDVICEKDSIDNCGEHGFKCAEQVEGWQDGTCEHAKCKVSACQRGLHVYENTCESDDLNSCGGHGIACNLSINGWIAGNCIDAICKVNACAEGMHVYENTCEFDSVENCGVHGRMCANIVAGWKSGACTQGECKVLQCIDGFHVDAATGDCVPDTKACCGSSCDTCGSEFVCAGGECRTKCLNTDMYCGAECVNTTASLTHCGACNHDCNAEKTANVKTMNCLDSACYVVDCDANYHIEIEDGKRVCKEDTVNVCGAEANDCTGYAWWDGGNCTNGQCVPSACKGDYHLAQNESGENWCEPDNNLNCGSHGLECTSGQTCVGGRCLGNTICDGVLRNTLTELEHCGDCNHRCDDGLICDKGQCKLGNGTAYCNGIKVTMGTIDRCSSCTDTCTDSLICQNNACVAGAGTTYCSGNTINSLDNIDHCGSCNNKCGNGLICSEGTCQTGNGQMYCSDVIIRSTNDSANCGGCNNLCPVGSRCGSLSGVVACIEGTGTTYCDGISRNTSNDSLNCGQCGKVCGVGEICSDGVCTTGTGTTYCNGISINTANDSLNCGQCGKVCGVGEICRDGVCTTGTGTTYCNGISINTANNFFNCGQCDYSCASNKICHNGTCTTPSVGETISFGHYEQDNDTTNGEEPIEWRVMDINDEGQILVISEKVLDVKPYNTTSIDITWEKSTIRSWLNGYAASYNTVGIDYTSKNFIDTAFNDTEKAKIVLSTVPAHANPSFSTSPGNATTDKIFLLSIVEANNYFADNAARQADATRYAVKKGVFVLGSESGSYTKNGTCTDVHCYAYWWLRSPGFDTHVAELVNPDGSVNLSSDFVLYGIYGVRPSLWVKY